PPAPGARACPRSSSLGFLSSADQPTAIIEAGVEGLHGEPPPFEQRAELGTGPELVGATRCREHHRVEQLPREEVRRLPRARGAQEPPRGSAQALMLRAVALKDRPERQPPVYESCRCSLDQERRPPQEMQRVDAYGQAELRRREGPFLVQVRVVNCHA